MMVLQIISLLGALAILALGLDVRRAADAAPWVGGLLVGLLLCAPSPLRAGWQPLLQVDAAQQALLLALLAFAHLRGRLPPRRALFAGGLLGGLWLQGLQMLGYPLLLVLPLATGLMLAAIVCPLLHAAYRVPRLQEEAMLLVLVAGLALAVVPGLLEGWRSAQLLQQGTSTADGPAPQAWVFPVALVCVALGALRVHWIYRRNNQLPDTKGKT